MSDDPNRIGSAVGWEATLMAEPPSKINLRFPAPTVQQYSAASSLIGAAHHLLVRNGSELGATYENVASQLGELVVRYGRGLGIARDADARWCGLPHVAGHIVAGAIVEDCRLDEATAGDERLVELVGGLADALWGGRRLQPLNASLALGRHACQYGYTGVDLPPLDTFGRCGRATDTQQYAALFYLCRAGLDRYGQEPRRDMLAVGLRALVEVGP